MKYCIRGLRWLGGKAWDYYVTYVYSKPRVGTKSLNFVFSLYFIKLKICFTFISNSKQYFKSHHYLYRARFKGPYCLCLFIHETEYTFHKVTK